LRRWYGIEDGSPNLTLDNINNHYKIGSFFFKKENNFNFTVRLLAIAATAELDNDGIAADRRNAILGSTFAKAFTGALGGRGGRWGGPIGRPLLGPGWLDPPIPLRQLAKADMYVMLKPVTLSWYIVLKPPMIVLEAEVRDWSFQMKELN